MTVFHRPNLNDQTVQGGFLTQDTTVNLDNSMSASDIQAEIDRQPKFLNGYQLLFQLADGTYGLNASLEFKGFIGGALRLYGNSSDTGSTKNVILNFNNSTRALYFDNCPCNVVVRYLQSQVQSTSDNAAMLASVCLNVQMLYCRFQGNSTTSGQGLWVLRSRGELKNSYLSNIRRGVIATNTYLFSQNNDDVGTQPAFALNSWEASEIVKDSTQPSGSTANENTADGGVIR